MGEFFCKRWFCWFLRGERAMSQQKLAAKSLNTYEANLRRWSKRSKQEQKSHFPQTGHFFLLFYFTLLIFLIFSFYEQTLRRTKTPKAVFKQNFWWLWREGSSWIILLSRWRVGSVDLVSVIVIVVVVVADDGTTLASVQRIERHAFKLARDGLNLWNHDNC